MGQTTYTLAIAPNGNLLFGVSATVTANAPAATVDGQAVSFGASGLVVNGASTFPVSAAAATAAAQKVGGQGQTLATPPPDSSFQQYKGNGSVAKAGSDNGAKEGKGSASGMDNGAAVGMRVEKSAFALLIGFFAMLLI
jgi:hypothetical protein